MSSPHHPYTTPLPHSPPSIPTDLPLYPLSLSFPPFLPSLLTFLEVTVTAGIKWNRIGRGIRKAGKETDLIDSIINLKSIHRRNKEENKDLGAPSKTPKTSKKINKYSLSKSVCKFDKSSPQIEGFKRKRLNHTKLGHRSSISKSIYDHLYNKDRFKKMMKDHFLAENKKNSKKDYISPSLRTKIPTDLCKRLWQRLQKSKETRSYSTSKHPTPSTYSTALKHNQKPHTSRNTHSIISFHSNSLYKYQKSHYSKACTHKSSSQLPYLAQPGKASGENYRYKRAESNRSFGQKNRGNGGMKEEKLKRMMKDVSESRKRFAIEGVWKRFA
ncbi:unnamed protein product [Moneuplotes crassus]|uniref:Uncharacterized protein n=1 Tax=Euplotes crassus TaxID=5936 RepID=A0AAD1U9T1_EUPCR|nr:unnamed protein product [Moneuplotes crassus]